jgi:hypothetical protein
MAGRAKVAAEEAHFQQQQQIQPNNKKEDE